MRLWVERESYLGFGNSRNEEDRKKYCEAKKYAKRIVYNGYGSESSKGGGESWFVMVVSSLELPNKGLGRRKMLLGLAVLNVTSATKW